MGGSKGGNQPSVQTQGMSDEMEASLIKQIDESVKISREAWDRFQSANIGASGENIEQQMNQWRAEALKGVRDKESELTEKMPEEVPGLKQAEETINKRYGDMMASTEREGARMDPYGSARTDAMAKTAEFARTGDLAKTRGEMTKGWNVQKSAIDNKNYYDWVARMTGTNPISSGASAGTATGAAGSAMSGTQNMLDMYNQRAANEVNAANQKDSNQANAIMNIAGWFI